MPIEPWQEIDWRAHQRWITVRGHPVNVVELGSGEPIIFIHGLGGSWQNWLEQLPLFARAHRVIALDLPGFGSSPLTDEEISVPGYVMTVQALLDALEIERVTAVGNSMGGLISAELALAAPERVARLALVSPAGIVPRHFPRQLSKILVFYPLVAGAAEWVSHNAEAAAHRARLRRLLMKTVADHPADIPPALVAEQFRGVGTPGFRLALEALVEYSIQDRLPDISCPTLIVWGEHDHVLPARQADVWAGAIANSRKAVLRETGHVAMLEHPLEFNALFAELLRAEPANAGKAPEQVLSA